MGCIGVLFERERFPVCSTLVARFLKPTPTMGTLIYKRTHSGDPDPDSGVFGSSGDRGCMGQVRGYQYDSVIGIGGISSWPQREGIAGRLTWVGLDAHKSGDPTCPLVTFDHFLYCGGKGDLVRNIAPRLYERIYPRKVRLIMSDSLTDAELAEVRAILRRASNAPSSGTTTKGRTISRLRCPPKRPRPC